MSSGRTAAGAAELPGGTVTFVLADVVGSTRLWQDHSEFMPAALARLDELVDTHLQAHGGVRPVEQGEGDSFVAVFSRASAAVGFAAAVTIALAVEPEQAPGIDIALRMALHTDDARVRGGGRYMGEALNRCARIRALGHGGQILLSSTTAELLADHLGDVMFLKDLGVHHLRDLNRPERVSQLAGQGLTFAFPPLRSLDRLPNNLPLQVTSFLGRDAELAGTAALLGAHRMVTLTGAGGCGKTRLSVQLGAEIVDQYPDGVWLVNLAPLADPALVPATVAGALGVTEVPGEAISTTVTEYLSGRTILLIIDNCEHLLDACVTQVEAVLHHCPGVTVLATSREPLGVDGEATYRVASLALPEHEADTTAASVALFVDRANLARPGLRLSPDARACVTSICRRLDGIPLAIELAAARCRALTPSQIAAQLDQRFELLSGGRRAGLPRQRTLEASVDWSYSLLDEAERGVLRRLSIFAGGFTLQAAQIVCGDGSADGWDAIDLVTSLVDKSLVQTDDVGDEARFRLLETIRHYARQKLLDAEESADALQRHAVHFAEVAVTAFAGLLGPRMAHWRAVLEAELDNIRAADDWAAGSGQADLALSFVGREFWFAHHLAEGMARIRRALELPGADPARRALSLTILADLEWGVYEWESSARACAEALEIARTLGDDAIEGEALNGLGWAAFGSGQEDAREYFAAAVAPLRAGGSTYRLADNYWGLGILDFAGGDPRASQANAREALALARALGNPQVLCRSLGFLGLALMFDSGLAEVDDLLAESDPLIDAAGDLFWRVCHDALVTWMAGIRGDLDDARTRALAAVSDGREHQHPMAAAWAAMALLCAEFRNNPPGADLPGLDETETALDETGALWWSAICRTMRAERARVAGDLAGARRFAESAAALARSTAYARRAHGRSLLTMARIQRAEGDPLAAEDTAHAALALVVPASMWVDATEVLEFLAGLAAAGGSAAEALRLFAAAQAARERTGYPLPPVEEPDVRRDREAARTGLDPAAVLAAEKEGAAMTLEEAAAYAGRGRGTRKRPSSGWESLTPSEAEVVRLVAEGLRNADIATRLFVSPETVKKHLSHVFAKLGLSSRSELAAAAVRRT